MKAIVLEKEKQFVKKDLAYPEKRPGYAIIKVQAVGICGSDIHAYNGDQPMFSYPKVIGHEISAEIVSADHFNKGDIVTVIPYISCKRCIACIQNKGNACEKLSVLGVHEDGALKEYLSVPEELLIPVNGLTPKQIALIEPLAISEHAFSRAPAKEDEFIAVSGIGPIGMGIVIMAKYRKAKIIAIDFNEDRLKFAKEVLKADYVLKPDDTLQSEISRITGQQMVTKLYDATGNQHAMNHSVNLIAHGGSIVFVGLHKGDIQLNDLAFHKRETTLLASRAAYKKDFETVIEMIQSKFFDPIHLITAEIEFDNFIDEYDEAVHKTNAIKSVVVF